MIELPDLPVKQDLVMYTAKDMFAYARQAVQEALLAQSPDPKLEYLKDHINRLCAQVIKLRANETPDIKALTRLKAENAAMAKQISDLTWARYPERLGQ